VPGITSIEKAFPRPAVIGVINVTPDSFSAGATPGISASRSPAASSSSRRARRSSTSAVSRPRPGADPVAPEEEPHRVGFVVEELVRARRDDLDRHAQTPFVAQAAVAAGASLVNDVSALRHDPHMPAVVPTRAVGLCLHAHGSATIRARCRTIPLRRRVDDVASFLEDRLAVAVDRAWREEAHLPRSRHFGSGKRSSHNLQLLRGLPRLARIGRPLLVRRLAQVVSSADSTQIRPRQGARRGPRSRRPSRPTAFGASRCGCTTSPRTVDAAQDRAGPRADVVTELAIEVLGLVVHAHHGVREHEKARVSGS